MPLLSDLISAGTFMSGAPPTWRCGIAIGAERRSCKPGSGTGRLVVRNRLDTFSGQKPCVVGREDEKVGLLDWLTDEEVVELTDEVLRRLS